MTYSLYHKSAFFSLLGFCFLFIVLLIISFIILSVVSFIICLLFRYHLFAISLLFYFLFCLSVGSGSLPELGFKIYYSHPVAFPLLIMGDDHKGPVFSRKEIICNLLF